MKNIYLVVAVIFAYVIMGGALSKSQYLLVEITADEMMITRNRNPDGGKLHIYFDLSNSQYVLVYRTLN